MTVFAKLAAFDPLLVYILIIGFFLGFSLALSFATRRYIDNQTRRGHNDIAGYIFTTVGAIYGVFLAFLTVIVWQNYNQAADNVTKGASASLALYRNLCLYPNQEQAGPAAETLLALIHSTITDEFPAMAEGKRSQAADQITDRLWTEVKKLNPQNFREQVLFQEILQHLNTMVQLRIDRVGMAMNPRFSGLMGYALTVGALITLISALLFGADNFWWQIALTSMLIVLVATILFVLIQLAHPFSSQVGVTPSDYREVLKLIKN